MTDTEILELFKAWWAESYPTAPPGVHMQSVIVAFSRYLMERICKA